MKQILKIAAILITCLAGGAIAGTEGIRGVYGPSPDRNRLSRGRFNQNLDLMLSLFTDDAVIMSRRARRIPGGSQLKTFWQAAGPFQPQISGWATRPSISRYNVQGDRAHLYFECLWVDKTANKIAAHTNSDDALVRIDVKRLIKEMKPAAVPDL